MKWSDIQGSYPFFWLWLTAWLKSKGAYEIRVNRGISNSEYVKVRFNTPPKEQELSEAMLNEMLEEAGLRICINFDKEDEKANWRYVINRKNIGGLWIQAYSSDYVFKKRKAAVWNGFINAFGLLNDSLKKQNAVELRSI